jgi:hypothetical protein
MTERAAEIRRVVAELDARLAEVEASMAVLRALVAEDGDEDLDGEISA